MVEVGTPRIGFFLGPHHARGRDTAISRQAQSKTKLKLVLRNRDTVTTKPRII
jgi:hypothetical protein